MDFNTATLGRESWTQITPCATEYNVTIAQGLDEPVWYKTILVPTGEVVESGPSPPNNNDVKIIDEHPQDIKTTVWHGKSKPKTTNLGQGSKLRKTLCKGIQTAAAIFLLEAMVLMSATSQWSGAWTQRWYGTGQADVWEIFGKDNLFDSRKLATRVKTSRNATGVEIQRSIIP